MLSGLVYQVPYLYVLLGISTSGFMLLLIAEPPREIKRGFGLNMIESLERLLCYACACLQIWIPGRIADRLDLMSCGILIYLCADNPRHLDILSLLG